MITIILIIIGYLLSVWISRWFIIRVYKQLPGINPDGLDLFLCILPILNLIITGSLWIIYISDGISNKFFKTK